MRETSTLGIWPLHTRAHRNILHRYPHEGNEGLSLQPFIWNQLLLGLVLWTAQCGKKGAQTIVRDAVSLGMVSSIHGEATLTTRHSYEVTWFGFLSLWSIADRRLSLEGAVWLCGWCNFVAEAKKTLQVRRTACAKSGRSKDRR